MGRATVARDHGRYTIMNEIVGRGCFGFVSFDMGVHVNKSRRNHKPGSASALGEFTSGKLVAKDSEITVSPR